MDVAIPDKPTNPVVETIKSTSITLSLPSWDSTSTDNYANISYCIMSENENWIQKKLNSSFNCRDTTVTVCDLQPHTTYIFKLTIWCPYGKSEDSDSEPITTLLGRPEVCIIKGDRQSIKIKWTNPKVNRIS